MYASRFTDGPRFRPASLGAALAINGGVIAALLLAGPELIPRRESPPITIEQIPLEQPEPDALPPPDTPRTAARSPERVDVTPPLPLPNPGQSVHVDPAPPLDEVGPGPIATATPAPTPTLRFVDASIDPRYAGDFQPEYPDVARDSGREGVVKLRVRIGTDGRVKQVERLSGEDIFWRAASRHALARWRFIPATRGDVPEESWRVMTVRFRLD